VTADTARPTASGARRAVRVGLVTLSIVATAVALNLVGGGALPSFGFGEEAQPEPDDEQLERGSALFGAHCALCHGDSGRGVPGTGPQHGPSLIGVGEASVDFMLRSGRMPMEDATDRMERRPPRYSDEDREAIVAFVESLAPREGPDTPDIEGWEDADLSHGLELFTPNWPPCHGPTAQGIAVGQRDISSSLDVVPPLEVAQAVRSGPGVMPRFLQDTLNEEELKAVTAWVQHLPERETPGGWSFGRSGPVVEGLLAFVIGLGGLTVVIYLLGERAR
jgi:ubiquinol-cytochrome c reductase cytochrome c subunit